MTQTDLITAKMYNFEIFDNVFQVVSLVIMMMVSGTSGFRHSSRKLVVLACAYGSISLGTLFYMLHLTIIGDIPRVFYVSEMSWMAGYLFFLFLVMLRQSIKELPLKPEPVLLAVFTFAASVYNDVMGNSVFVTAFFGLIAAAIVYISASRLLMEDETIKAKRSFDLRIILAVVLQILVYFVSEYVKDFSRFNLYYAVDIAFTLCICSLYWLIKKEVQQS